MAEVKVTVTGDSELIARFNAMRDSLRSQTSSAISELQYRLQGVIRQLLSGDVLHPRTGLLRNSISVQPVQESGDTISGAVSANTPYAAIQEYGGTIRPTTAQALTIPLDAVLTGAGVARYTAREVFDSPSIGGFTNVFIAKGVIFGKAGKGNITPLFALKPEVTLPPRPYMSRGLDSMSDEVQARLSQVIQEATNG